MRASSVGAHLRDLAEQHRSEETSQRWQVVGDTVLNLNGAGIEYTTFRVDNNAVNFKLIMEQKSAVLNLNVQKQKSCM